MRYRIEEKVEYYMKRAYDPRATRTQRDYACGFVNGIDKARAAIGKDTSDKALEGMQKSKISIKTKSAMSSGEKQGSLTVINELLHARRKHPLYGEK